MEKFRQNLNNANVLFLDVRKSSEIEGGKITAENWLNILHTDVGKEFSLSKEEFEVFKSNNDLVGDKKIPVLNYNKFLFRKSTCARNQNPQILSWCIARVEHQLEEVFKEIIVFKLIIFLNYQKYYIMSKLISISKKPPNL